MRHRRDIPDRANFQTRALQTSNRRIPAGPRTLDTHFDRPHTHIPRLLSSRHRRLLGSKRRTLTGTPEPERSGAGPAHDVPIGVGNRYDRIVERRLNINVSSGNDFLFALFPLFSSSLWPSILLMSFHQRRAHRPCTALQSRAHLPDLRSLRLRKVKRRPVPHDGSRGPLFFPVTSHVSPITRSLRSPSSEPTQHRASAPSGYVRSCGSAALSRVIHADA